jgi:gliding motility-associated-like protein
MKKSLIIFLLVFVNSIFLIAQNVSISGVINNYVSVYQIGSGNCIDTLYVGSNAGFSDNDTILLIQMKGALIDTSNSIAFGSILNYNNAGNYEFGYVKSVGSGFIVLKNSLLKTYSPTAALQLVRVPSYNNATVTGLLTATTWNGNIGGVLAFFVNGTLTLNSNIDVSGKGFQGGSTSINYYTGYFNGYYCSHLSGRGGDKGEGISVLTLNQVSGRGANSNGGGGGNDINTGAGGGGNAGSGGHGGNNFFSNNFLWGEAGESLNNLSSFNRLFLGGGGGGGHQNNSLGTNGSNGGGIIFIKANTIIGNGNSINANGLDVVGVSTIDGAGGGGAGGTILVDIQNYTGALTLKVKGGKGGDQIYIPQCHGNGGGGGGGAIKKNTILPFPINIITNIAGGGKGVGQCNGSINDALDGSDGAIYGSYQIDLPQMIVANAGIDTAICLGSTIQLGDTAQSGLLYNWNNAAGNISNPLVHPLITTTYILTVTQLGACPLVATDTVTVFVTQAPQAAFNYSNYCAGLQIKFNNTSQFYTNSYWSFGDGLTDSITSPTHAYADTGLYEVILIVENGFGCIDSNRITIHVTQELFPVAEFSYNLLNCSANVQFINASSNSFQWVWSFGDGSISNEENPNHLYSQPGVFIVTLIVNGSTNCPDTIHQEITIDDLTINGLFIPNAFTPNHDEKNDKFEIKSSKLCEDFQLLIYNRWGQLVYQTNNILNSWDGKYKNKICPAGVYYYLLNGKSNLHKGTVSLLR